MVIGNKSDLHDEQVVSKEEGKEYVKSINTLFMKQVQLIMNVLKIYLKKKKKKKKKMKKIMKIRILK